MNFPTNVYFNTAPLPFQELISYDCELFSFP